LIFLAREPETALRETGFAFSINPCIGSTALDMTALTFHPMQGMATGTIWPPALPFLGPKGLQPLGEKGRKRKRRHSNQNI